MFLFLFKTRLSRVCRALYKFCSLHWPKTAMKNFKLKESSTDVLLKWNLSGSTWSFFPHTAFVMNEYWLVTQTEENKGIVYMKEPSSTISRFKFTLKYPILSKSMERIGQVPTLYGEYWTTVSDTSFTIGDENVLVVKIAHKVVFKTQSNWYSSQIHLVDLRTQKCFKSVVLHGDAYAIKVDEKKKIVKILQARKNPISLDNMEYVEWNYGEDHPGQPPQRRKQKSIRSEINRKYGTMDSDEEESDEDKEKNQIEEKKSMGASILSGLSNVTKGLFGKKEAQTQQTHATRKSTTSENNNNNNNNNVENSKESKENIWQDNEKCFSKPISLFKFPGDSVPPNCLISNTRIVYTRKFGSTSPLYIYDLQQQSLIIDGELVFWNDELERPDLAKQPNLPKTRPGIDLLVVDSYRFFVHLHFNTSASVFKKRNNLYLLEIPEGSKSIADVKWTPIDDGGMLKVASTYPLYCPLLSNARLLDVNQIRGDLPRELFDTVFVERIRANASENYKGGIRVVQLDWTKRSIHTKFADLDSASRGPAFSLSRLSNKLLNK